MREMSKERSFRSDEAAAFDWYRSARELDVPVEVARALYVRAMQRAADARRAEGLYLRWLRDAAQDAAPAAPPPPGRKTLVISEAERASGSRQRSELGLLDPGRWTRTLLEAGETSEANEANEIHDANEVR